LGRHAQHDLACGTLQLCRLAGVWNKGKKPMPDGIGFLLSYAC